jgi:6-phosphofructokinase 2
MVRGQPRSSVSRVIATLTLNPAIDLVTSVAHVSTHGKLRCSQPILAPGGGGVNVSRTVTALGGRTTAVFTCGGATGERLVELLDAEGVPGRPIAIEGETRQNILVRETASGRELHFVMPGPSLHDAEWQACLDAIADLETAPTYVAASGTLPPGVPPDFYGRLADTVRARGGRLVLDTSGEPLRLALERGAWLIKPNVRELAELAGASDHDEPALEAAARSLVAQGGCEALVLSLGRGGAFLTSREIPGLYVRSPVVRQASRVGAGDGMVGGMVLALDDGQELEDAVLRGVASGAATVMRADRGPCRREDAARLYALVAATATRSAA